VTRATSAREHRSNDVTLVAKLCRMLRSTLRRYPQARLLNTQDAFGVWLDERMYLQVSYSGHWTAEDMRDCLALFATWLIADPSRILSGGTRLDGVLQTAQAASDLSSGLEDSNGKA